MSDFNSSVPVRTETTGPEAYGLIAKLADAGTPSQQLAINADGAASIVVKDIAITAQTNDLKVTLDGEAVVLGAGDANIGDVDVVSQPARTHATDSMKVGDGTEFLSITAEGQAEVAVTAALPAGTNNIGDVDVLTEPATAADAAALPAVLKVVAGYDGAAVRPIATDASGNIQADILTQPARSHSTDSMKVGDGTDFLAVNVDGSINVAIVQGLSGGEVHNYNTAAAIAGAATSNHDYIVTAAKTLKLFQVLFAASGKMKAELQVETGVATNTFNTLAVGFFDGASPNGGTGEFNLRQPIEVAAGVRVRVIRTNRANQSQDLYSTFIGDEV